ncbi:hypothetical protein Cni_G06525 [Canna indica]|uniref:Uncharacterized protein n=1 Tax=Canna indica TaxID=4628 RepID=A0AAQ3JZH4_9LILI|nr:hypothetical protein Cni_G06525 [Canna indica]
MCDSSGNQSSGEVQKVESESESQSVLKFLVLLGAGGLLEASMFLDRRGDSSPLREFGEVVSGVGFSATNSLNEVASLVKKGVLRPLDLRFFVGYAGWQFDQLLDEIDSGYWVIVALAAHI